MNNLYDQNKYELEYVAGDKPVDMDKGITTSVNVQAHATAWIRYREQILECELYVAGTEMTLHMLCPKCRHGLKISNKNKEMDWDGKYISVERSGCTWEIDDMLAAGVLTHTNLCNFKFVIDRGMMRDV